MDATHRLKRVPHYRTTESHRLDCHKVPYTEETVRTISYTNIIQPRSLVSSLLPLEDVARRGG